MKKLVWLLCLLPIPVFSATWTGRVSSSGRDIWVGSVISVADTTNGGVSARLGNEGTPIAFGAVFTNVTIDPGVTIDSAFHYLRASASEANNTVNVFLWCEDTASARDRYETDTATLFPRLRNRTTAMAYWSSVVSFTSGTTYKSANCGPAIQEIVNRGDWANGNNLGVVIADSLWAGSNPNAATTTGGAAIRKFHTWDTDAPTCDSILIYYHAGSPPAGTIQTQRARRKGLISILNPKGGVARCAVR